MNNLSAVPLHGPPSSAPLWFFGDRNEFRQLVTTGTVLELLTVGFYRFWLATDIRRHLWSNTTLEDDPFEYTGRGKELLIGFLFALAIIVPVYLAYFLVGIEAERIRTFASFPLIAFFYVFGQFAIYRARRYRLTRTVWRGVRFWMTGSGWGYAARSALWLVATMLTLGLMLPWRQAALERYKMRHTYYGDLQASFAGRGTELFRKIWWLWLLTPVALVVFPLLPFLYAAFKAMEWRWWISGIRFGRVRLQSTLPRNALITLYWKTTGWFLLLSIGFGLYLFFCPALVGSVQGMSLDQSFAPGALSNSIPLLVMMGFGYIVWLLALNIVVRVYLLRDAWTAIVNSTIVHGVEAAADVYVTGDLATALGEGFADGLDVAGL